MMARVKPRRPAAPHAACTCGSLRKASRRISQFYDTALAPVGIKSTQFSILSEVERGSVAGPVTMCELASAMVMDRSTLGHNLRPLERDDLIVLRQARHDGRKRPAIGPGHAQAGHVRLQALRKSLDHLLLHHPVGGRDDDADALGFGGHAGRRSRTPMR